MRPLRSVSRFAIAAMFFFAVDPARAQSPNRSSSSSSRASLTA
jgi:hypothetical protein